MGSQDSRHVQPSKINGTSKKRAGFLSLKRSASSKHSNLTECPASRQKPAEKRALAKPGWFAASGKLPYNRTSGLLSKKR
jgi:hypothetical protein